jgi:hypothetical protein
MLIINLFKKNEKRFSVTILIIGLIFALIIVSNKPASSQSITGLNAEISSLRSRINRLESEVRNIRTSNYTPGLPSDLPERESIDGEIENPPVVNDRPVGKSDPLFERLATLIIELKEDVNNIENRLNVLEEQI